MNRNPLFAAVPLAGASAGLSGWIDALAHRMLRRAARTAPESLSERLEEEWLADLSERRGLVSRLSFALGCCWAVMVIRRDHLPVKIPASSSTSGTGIMTAYAYRGTALFSRRTTAAAPGTVFCDINTTPLIDVMLVLLVTLIVSLPIMTHAVRLDLPQTLPPRDTPRPEVINLDIDFDGTVVWNGTAIASLQQLEGYLHTEAQKDPQPEIHLRPDPRVKYDVVAKVLASAQHNRMRKMGFVNTSEFKN